MKKNEGDSKYLRKKRTWPLKQTSKKNKGREKRIKERKTQKKEKKNVKNRSINHEQKKRKLGLTFFQKRKLLHRDAQKRRSESE